MGLGSSCLEKVVIPYANSPSTNPDAKVMFFSEPAMVLKKIPGRTDAILHGSQNFFDNGHFLSMVGFYTANH